MSFDIPQFHIPDNSPEAQVVERIMSAENVGPTEAVCLILRKANTEKNPALEGLGLFSSPEDAAAIDAAVTIAYEERRRPSRRNIGL